MKIVKVVLFGCEMRSTPVPNDRAKQVVQWLEARQVKASADDLTQPEALQILKGLRPVAGTDPDFDYEKGQPKVRPNVIVVTQRSNDIHVCLKDYPEIWGCGKTQYEAIGSLISAHGERFNTELSTA